MINNILKLGLCEGRHNIPVDDYIFPANYFDEVNMFDWGKIGMYLRKKFYEFTSLSVVHLYITGFTPALTSVLNYFEATNSYYIVLHHYNRDTDEYVPQLYQPARWYMLYDKLVANDEFNNHVKECVDEYLGILWGKNND